MVRTKKSQASQRPLPDSPTVINAQDDVEISMSSAQEAATFLQNQVRQGSLSLQFVTKEEIGKLHDHYFNDPTSTDCISLFYGEPHFLGEVIVCPAVAVDYAKDNGLDLSQELTLYVVHGFLHLIGFDDITEDQRELMRTEEKKWVAKLAKNGLGVTIQ